MVVMHSSIAWFHAELTYLVRLRVRVRLRLRLRVRVRVRLGA